MFEKMEDPRKLFGATVHEAARARGDIVILSADSGLSSGFGAFRDEFPERYFEFGIMEQGVTGFASGLATTGKIPVFCAIAPFVTSRPFEMFRNDLGYMRQNVKIVGRNSGVSYSDLGATHHSLEDFAIVRMIPGVVILAPTDPDEIRGAVYAMLDYEGPVYMRIGNDPIPNLHDDGGSENEGSGGEIGGSSGGDGSSGGSGAHGFEIGRGRLIYPGKDITLVATGSITAYAVMAVDELRRRRISVELISMPTVVPIDQDLLLRSIRKTGRVATLEEHYVIGGLGTIVQEIVSELHPVQVKKLGLPHGYTSSGPYEELLRYYGLDASGIAASVEQFLEHA